MSLTSCTAERCPVTVPAGRAPISTSSLNAVLNPYHYILGQTVPRWRFFLSHDDLASNYLYYPLKGHVRAPGFHSAHIRNEDSLMTPTFKPSPCVKVHFTAFITVKLSLPKVINGNEVLKGISDMSDHPWSLQKHQCLLPG